MVYLVVSVLTFYSNNPSLKPLHMFEQEKKWTREAWIGQLFTMGHPQPLLIYFLSSQTNPTRFAKIHCEIFIYVVFGTGIRTHSLSIKRLNKKTKASAILNGAFNNLNSVIDVNQMCWTDFKSQFWFSHKQPVIFERGWSFRFRTL